MLKPAGAGVLFRGALVGFLEGLGVGFGDGLGEGLGVGLGESDTLGEGVAFDSGRWWLHATNSNAKEIAAIGATDERRATVEL